MPTLNIPLPIKGLVVDRPGEFVDARSHTAGKNVRVKKSIIETRPGTTSVGSTLSERIQRYFELENEDGTTNLIRVGVTDVQKLTKATATWVSVANAALTGTEADQVDYAFPILSGARIATFTNSVDAIRKYTGIGNDADLGGSPPKAKYMEAFGTYLFLANITNDGSGNAVPYRVQRSDTGDPETWSGGNSGSSDLLLDPGPIMGIKTWGNLLTVHKRESIYVGQLLTTSNVIRFDRKSTGVGTIAFKTILTLPTGEQIFLAVDGIHVFNGITAPLIPSPIQDEIREQLNPAHMDKSEAIIKQEDDEVWISLPLGSQTNPETIYKYNYRLNEIYKDERSNLTAMGLFLSTNDISWDDAVGTWDEQTAAWDDNVLSDAHLVVILGDSTGVSTKVSTGSNDNGSAVESQIETKDFTSQDFGDPDFGSFVRWSMLETWAKGTNLKIEYSTDSGTSWATIDDISLDSDYPTDDDPDIFYFDVVSTKIRFRFSKDGTSESFTLKKYTLHAIVREKRMS